MISLRQRLKAERKATSAAKKTAEKAISSAEQNATAESMGVTLDA